jgi:hypothetical protein
MGDGGQKRRRGASGFEKMTGMILYLAGRYFLWQMHEDFQ